MKSLLTTAALAWLMAAPAWAHGDHAPAPAASSATAPSVARPAPQLDAHTKQDIERHRGMARAHEQAAQCLASGTRYEVCQKQLQASCKGLAIGQYCGMRHVH